MKHLRNTRGYTLVELVVVMAIFVIVMVITSNSFLTVIGNAGQQSKSAETQIQGIVGLELLRSDLQQAGFGLPWSFQNTLDYDEAQETSNDEPMSGIWPASAPPSGGYWANSFNDAPGNAPRAILSANTEFNKDSGGVGSKYLVIKSTLVAPVVSATGAPPAARKWTTVSFSGGGHTIRTWGDPARELSASDRVIVVKNSLTSTPPSQQLMVNASGGFSTTFGVYSTLTQPHQDGDTFQVYGVHPSTNLSMPFNRADYYVARPAAGMSQACAPNTGILYKSVLDHADGRLSDGTALLDCVADMQVVYGLDTTTSGFVNDHPSSLPATYTAQDIRTQLKEVRVYILAHEGKRDRSYTHPSRYVTVGERLNELVRGREFDLQARIGPEWNRYRWKVYTIVVRPKNLIQ